MVATVAMVPTIGQAFERLIGVWPSVQRGRARDPRGVQGLAVRARARHDRAGLIAFSLVGFPFVFSTVTLAVVFGGAGPGAGARGRAEPRRPRDRASSSRAPRCCSWGSCSTRWPAAPRRSGGTRSACSRSRSASPGTRSSRTPTGPGSRSSSLGAVLILASAPFHRATWTTFGVIGFFGATLNYDSDWFGSWKSPALMVAVSVGLILLGMVLVALRPRRGRRGFTGRTRRSPPPAGPSRSRRRRRSPPKSLSLPRRGLAGRLGLAQAADRPDEKSTPSSRMSRNASATSVGAPATKPRPGLEHPRQRVRRPRRRGSSRRSSDSGT